MAFYTPNAIRGLYMLTPAEIVDLLSPTTPDLTPRIGCMKKTWTAEGTKISGRFFYVALRDSKPTIDDLITIAHARLVNFVMPRARINEVVAEMTASPGVLDPWVLLMTEARDLFMRTDEETGRSGELGELLLYMLIEWVLKAPIVACKMYLKTAQQMPVHGVDGIHLGYESDKLIMYWGESKLHSTLHSALDDISSSISSYVSDPKKYENEVRIVRSNLNLDAVDEMAKLAIKDYFNPYKPESNNFLESYACLAGFDSVLYDKVSTLDHSACEAAFCEAYDKRVESACKMIVKKVKAAGLDHLRFSYFLLPFPSVDDARAKFQARLWGTK
ncbi:HamA C-terminal domain-containing protein [Pleomorphomonas sp. T1.2MG-36]|uniref:HamA C-terminal domain-containing protein n=1 Tax=Pleomorphomonas sp. T1.2MG-36 TaxID=3041167 RepID=UPI0025412F4B|nr:DUF1837 domain-containing protein [Pleomorphomonas sp. T1.2MG-36]